LLTIDHHRHIKGSIFTFGVSSSTLSAFLARFAVISFAYPSTSSGGFSGGSLYVFLLLTYVEVNNLGTSSSGMLSDIVVGAMPDNEDHMFWMWATSFTILVLAWYVLYGSYRAEEYWCGLGIYDENKLATKNETGYSSDVAYWQCILAFHNGTMDTHIQFGLMCIKTFFYFMGTVSNVVGVAMLLGAMLFQAPEIVAGMVAVVAAIARER
jgi:hypothetical protein